MEERKKKKKERESGIRIKGKRDDESDPRGSHPLLHFPLAPYCAVPSAQQTRKWKIQPRCPCRDALWNLINTKWICPAIANGREACVCLRCCACERACTRARDDTIGRTRERERERERESQWDREPWEYSERDEKNSGKLYAAKIGCWPSSPRFHASIFPSFIIAQCCRSALVLSSSDEREKCNRNPECTFWTCLRWTRKWIVCEYC